jgi:hypothetical protein
MKPALQERCSECGRKKPAPRKASAKAKANRARLRARKAAKYEKHRLSTGTLRAVALERSGGWCEWCLLVAFTDYDPPHMHHMAGGAGQRREKQSIQNLVMLCRGCHRGYHEAPAHPLYREYARGHCARHSYPVPSVFLREPRAQRAPSPSSPSIVHEPVRRPNVG